MRIFAHDKDLVPLKTVVALLWLIAGLLVFVSLDRPSDDDIVYAAAKPKILSAAGGP